MKKNFFLKLNPPRPTFKQDMTDDERNTMQKHVAYWQSYVQDGTVIVLGPVMDPKGGYGIAVVSVDTEEQLANIVSKDTDTIRSAGENIFHSIVNSKDESEE